MAAENEEANKGEHKVALWVKGSLTAVMEDGKDGWKQTTTTTTTTSSSPAGNRIEILNYI